MKNLSGALLHFSGYPLRVANEHNEKTRGTKSGLSVLKSPKRTSIRNDIANNPKNWDISWFGNYE